MASNPIHEKRCPSCGQWTDGHQSLCTHCGYDHKEEQRTAFKRRREVDDLHIPIWRSEPSDPWWLTIAKRPVQLVQLVLYGIVAFLIYLGTAFAH